MCCSVALSLPMMSMRVMRGLASSASCSAWDSTSSALPPCVPNGSLLPGLSDGAPTAGFGVPGGFADSDISTTSAMTIRGTGLQSPRKPRAFSDDAEMDQTVEAKCTALPVLHALQHRRGGAAE